MSEKGEIGIPQETPAPNLSTQVKELFALVEKKNATYLSSILFDQLLRLVKTRAPEDKIRKALNPYKDEMGGKDKVELLTSKLLNIINESSEETSGAKETKASLLQQLGIESQTVFYTETGDPIFIKQIHQDKNTIDIVNEQGVYKTNMKLLGTSKDGILSLSNGKDKLRLRLSSPIHSSEEVADLEQHEGEHIPVDVGDIFADSKGIPWRIDQILVKDHANAAIFKLTTTDGTNVTRHMHIRDWDHENGTDIIKTLGDRLTLSRSREVTIAEDETEEVTPEAAIKTTAPVSTPETTETRLQSIKYPTSEGGNFKLEKGVSYSDDERALWEVTSIIDHGNDTETITIKNQAGDVLELPVKEWDAYPESLLITTTDEREHLFDKVKEALTEKIEAIEEIAEPEETPETPVQELSSEELRQKLEYYKALLERVNNMLK